MIHMIVSPYYTPIVTVRQLLMVVKFYVFAPLVRQLFRIPLLLSIILDAINVDSVYHYKILPLFLIFGLLDRQSTHYVMHGSKFDLQLYRCLRLLYTLVNLILHMQFQLLDLTLH